MLYRVKPIADAASSGTAPWQDIQGLRLCHHMGNRPEHFPETEVKMAYDDTSVSVMFRVMDRFVRATATKHQQSVCGDSCVEFFFSPGADITHGYFNLEINCGGTILFHFHPLSERGNVIELPVSRCNRIECHHSLPRLVSPEINESITWTIVCRIPLDILEDYLQPTTPAPGTIWHGNFYKCADRTSHPHWLTWAPVEAPKPDFHLPRFFGTLQFE